MRFTTLLFDLDDTLYPASTGLWSTLKARMNDYMSKRMRIPETDIGRLREKYFKQYGTTLRGLQANHEIDTQDFLAYVHDVPLEDYLTPDPLQREIIASLPARKLVFTNADVPHAERVLAALQLEGLFDAIVDVNAIAPHCKPMPEAFSIAMQIAGEGDPARCVMIDDLPRTTRAAKAVGLFGILYGQAAAQPDADASFSDWRQLPALLNGIK